MKSRQNGFTLVESLLAMALAGLALAGTISYMRQMQRDTARDSIDTELDYVRLTIRNLTTTAEICKDAFRDPAGRAKLDAGTNPTEMQKFSVNGVDLLAVNDTLPGGATLKHITLKPLESHAQAQITHVYGSDYKYRPVLLTLDYESSNHASQSFQNIVDVFTADDLEVLGCAATLNSINTNVRDFCDFVGGTPKNGTCQLPGLYFGGFYQLGDNVEHGVNIAVDKYPDTTDTGNFPDGMLKTQAYRDHWCEAGNPIMGGKCTCPEGFKALSTNEDGEFAVDYNHWDHNFLCVQQ